MPAKIKPAQLRDAFITDLATCWQHARALHPKETPYAFALHGLEDTPHVYPYVLTEEGLTRTAKRYLAMGSFETLEEARKELRFSMEDSPYAGELESQLPTVDALVEPVEADLDETEGYALLAKAAMDAFAVLDRRGTFGNGKAREKLWLMIDTSLAEKDWSLASVRRLNSSVAVKRYIAATKLEGDYVSADNLTLSADGRRLGYYGYGEGPRGWDDSFLKVVVTQILGLRLKKSWDITMRHEGIVMGILGAGNDVIVTATEIPESDDDESGEKCRATLTRYVKGDKGRKIQINLDGEPLQLTPNTDGSRVALMLNGKVMMLDEKMNVVATGNPGQKVMLKRFLKSGDLLGIASERLVKINSEFKVTLLPYRDRVNFISLNAPEDRCAVSTFSRGSKPTSRQTAKDQFGFKLLDFPKMQVRHHILVPAHQLTKAILSPDGRWVASRADECGKYTSHIVVHDVKSGREIARRNAKEISDMLFLPGKSVLILGIQGHMKTEPVRFWKFA